MTSNSTAGNVQKRIGKLQAEASIIGHVLDTVLLPPNKGTYGQVIANRYYEQTQSS